ncbi:major facilitator superfamily domain-containing protein [Penicillium capsulatum]|uniref:Major facilitator superfamily domain-containing protein n=1 Tax=Penicillium capsulatum TaxID=69766 RepID=A0A9W9ITY6_9EURO|nr:major facilitator superfamily domain-containing protein [Penicillium capsulatum]
MSTREKHHNDDAKSGYNGTGSPFTSDVDTYDVAFDGDQDPFCSRSMPLIRKWLIVIIVCTGTLCVTCASSIYTTTYAQMNPEMKVSQIVATLGLSLFVLGIGLGPLLTGPLSEWHGRRPVYLISWSLFIIWNITTAVGRNIQTILISRFLTGFAGGTFLAVSGGTVSDVFPRQQIQLPMTLVSSAPFIGPCLGPLIGGFISYNTHWRWNYYFAIIWGAILLVSIIFFAPETHHSLRLKAKAEMLRRQTGNESYRAPWGLSFLGVIFGMLLAAASAPLWTRVKSHLLASGKVTDEAAPEFCLIPAIPGGVLIPVGLFWFGWTVNSHVHWMVPIIGSAFFGCG